MVLHEEVNGVVSGGVEEGGEGGRVERCDFNWCWRGGVGCWWVDLGGGKVGVVV